VRCLSTVTGLLSLVVVVVVDDDSWGTSTTLGVVRLVDSLL
jgi:hypothetical protein